MLDHGLEAREISRRGRQWITDLVFHPDAKWENDSGAHGNSAKVPVECDTTRSVSLCVVAP